MNIYKMTEEELEQLSYTDIAYEILKKEKKEIKTLDLFQKVCELLEIEEEEMMEKIGDFFTTLTTDKRFFSLPQGLWDLKEKHSNKIKINEDDEDLDSLDIDEDEQINEDSNEDDYSEESTDDYEENDLEDLVVINSDEDDED